MYFTQFETNLINRQNTRSVSHSVRRTREKNVTKFTRNLRKNVSPVGITSDITLQQVTHKVYTDPKNFQRGNELK